MKFLILNSGLGHRKGILTSEHPKCMTEIFIGETILSRQLRLLADSGITDVVVTTDYYDEVLEEYCLSLGLPLNITFVKNPEYAETNYIYSIYCARNFLDDDIILMHGDLVFERSVLEDVIASDSSCMTVSSTLPLPKKDFKAVIHNGRIDKVGIDFFDNAISAQPLYKLKRNDWKIWLEKIVEYCENGNRKCYAENAFNEISDKCIIAPLDIENRLCAEVDTPEDLKTVSEKMKEIKSRTVYMCFSTDILHSGHLVILHKAAALGKVTVGVLSDSAVASFKRFPLLPYEERKAVFESLKDVERVVCQETLSYKGVIELLHPDIIVHGDDWCQGFQKPLRDEAEQLLKAYGGRLVEFPYTDDPRLRAIENRNRADAAVPDIRRGRLKKLLQLKGFVRVLEAHSGLSGLIVENATVYQSGLGRSFDGMWISSLCDSTMKGKPDIELVDMTSRIQTINEIMDVTTKPIILDGDTGGQIEHFVHHIRTLERMGVSAIIIEDKTGPKKNSLFGTQVPQTQDSIENFCAKIAAGKHAMRTREFMLIARIESLILEQGMEDALSRAFAYTQAGADGIMIHSRRKEPDEIFTFVEKFRSRDKTTPLVVAPTSFHDVTEEEFEARGVNIVIYANQLIRSAFPAMQQTAESILKNHRAKEADEQLLSIQDIITLIPNDEP